MKRSDKRLNSRGFTLIEVMLYLAIFSFMIGAIVGLAAVASASRLKNEVIANVNAQGEAVLALMTSTINNASSINSPLPNNSANTLSLTGQNNLLNPIVFDTRTDSTTTHIEINENLGSVLDDLTNSHVVVSNLSFANYGVNGSKGSINIQFTLTYLSSSTRSEFNYSKAFYGAASVR